MNFTYSVINRCCGLKSLVERVTICNAAQHSRFTRRTVVDRWICYSGHACVPGPFNTKTGVRVTQRSILKAGLVLSGALHTALSLTRTGTDADEGSVSAPGARGTRERSGCPQSCTVGNISISMHHRILSAFSDT